MPRELALKRIWKEDNYFTKRSMDVFMARLRKHLEGDPAISLINVHGSGYRLHIEE
jgi:DNA-binding response OmpR family regulator